VAGGRHCAARARALRGERLIARWRGPGPCRLDATKVCESRAWPAHCAILIFICPLTVSAAGQIVEQFLGGCQP
jgi:hypothetical protein